MLPVHTATLVARAVIRFAETGEGDLGWDPPYHVLRAGFHNVLLTIEPRGFGTHSSRPVRVAW